MAATPASRLPLLAVATALVGAVVAAVIGLLTFGAQATAHPDRVPLGIAVPADAPQLRAAAERMAGQAGDIVSVRVTTADAARDLLDRKEIYGYVQITPGTPPATTVVISDAVNPSGTLVAQQFLTQVTWAIGQSGTQLHNLHPASQAGRTLPLAASGLLWISGMVGALLFGLLTVRRGIRAGLLSRTVLAVTVSLAEVAVVIGFARLWDDTLTLSAGLLGFLLLTALAFAAVQGALFRLLRIRAMAILGPLYLIAPAIAGQVPEILNPAYRALLWSWSPFRFSTEGARGLLLGTPSAPDVRTGVLVLSVMAVAGLAVLLWPGGSPGEQAEPDAADRVVPVGVDQADRLPGAERELAAEHGDGGVGR